MFKLKQQHLWASIVFGGLVVPFAFPPDSWFQSNPWCERHHTWKHWKTGNMKWGQCMTFHNTQDYLKMQAVLSPKNCPFFFVTLGCRLRLFNLFELPPSFGFTQSCGAPWCSMVLHGAPISLGKRLCWRPRWFEPTPSTHPCTSLLIPSENLWKLPIPKHVMHVEAATFALLYYSILVQSCAHVSLWGIVTLELVLFNESLQLQESVIVEMQNVLMMHCCIREAEPPPQSSNFNCLKTCIGMSFPHT